MIQGILEFFLSSELMKISIPHFNIILRVFFAAFVALVKKIINSQRHIWTIFIHRKWEPQGVHEQLDTFKRSLT